MISPPPLARNQSKHCCWRTRNSSFFSGSFARSIALWEGIEADIAQFEKERDFPYQQVKYMQSLLQDLPVGVASYEYTEPSGLGSLFAGAEAGGDIYDYLNNILNS